MTRERVAYAFDHLVGSYAHPEGPHAGDSRDLAFDEFDDAMSSLDLFDLLAEHVAGNYGWTGEAEEVIRRIESGDL